ncbi:MAG: hypothetical protein NTY47_05330, partial [Candidatus Omnitrophica bacterium]|nr:hypothetical protein [Candidatus Omnitrophota bacterium]
MMNLRKNKFIKIICLVLVLSFSSQQVGFADVKDLRDDSGTFGSLLSILQGYMAGRAVKPEWTVAQTWTYTYIIPTLSKQVVNMVGIKGTAGIVATTMLATFATAKLDYTASAQIDKVGLNAEKVLAKGGEGSVANAVGENVIQGAGSETLTNAVDEGTKQALKRPDGRVINHSVQNAAKGGTLSQLGNMGKALFSGGVIMKGAIIDAITTGVMVLVKKLVARMLDKTAKYIQEALSYLLAKYAGEALRIALQRRFAVLLGFSPSKGPTARGAEEDKVKVNFKDGTSQVMTTAEADALSPADVVSKEAVFQTWVLETPKELAKKQKEDDTRVIANAPIRSLGGANTKSSEIGGATITPIV